MEKNMEEIVALCKRRGFIYPSSDIYGGITGFWDYGPMGVELKNNIKREWWKKMVYQREDVVGLDAAIVMNPVVWEKSGHVEGFTDPLIECKLCHERIRLDKKEEIEKHSSSPHLINNEKKSAEWVKENIQWTEPKKFNLLTEVFLGATEPKQKAYLRGEITQGVFVNFKNVIDSTRIKIPFGIAQIGKAFRNEVTPGNFTFRSREFEQMELEFFIKPNEAEGDKWFQYWKEERMKWYLSLGIQEKNLRFRDHRQDERAHYAKFATDIEYKAPFGSPRDEASWSEFEGIHHRGDWDLGKHGLQYLNPLSGESFTPWVLETSGGVDRATLFFLVDAYCKEEKRIILKLNPKIAPIKAAVFPLVSNKEEIVGSAREVFLKLKNVFNVAWDDRGNIGKRYLSQDEIGTPFCVTIDYQTLEDKTVTVRDRDTTKQERLPIDKLILFIKEKLSI